MPTLRHAGIVLVLTAALLSAGCYEGESVHLLVADRIVAPGGTVEVVAQIQRSGWSRWFPPADPPAVRFYRGNELLGEVRPLGTNVVSVRLTVDEPGEHPVDVLYQPRPGRPPIQAACYAHCWDGSRVAIAVDLDRVVNFPSQFDRWTLDVPLGEVRDEAAEVLAALARHFNICYLTEFDLQAKEQVRSWMRTHRLPPGPIFNWRRAARYNPLSSGDQARVLTGLRESAPTLLIGIGGGPDDLAAFIDNGMLAVLIDYAGDTLAAPNVPRLDNWRAVWQFFTYETNFPVLTDPKVMLDLHYHGGQYVGLGAAAPQSPVSGGH